MNDIYRIKSRKDVGVRKLDKRFVVTPPSLWLILLGGILLVCGIMIWICTGWMIETVGTTGLYHPGASPYGEVIAFVPLQSGKQIDEGMEVTLYAAGYNQQEYGHMKAEVTYVEDYITTSDELNELLQSESMVKAYAQSGPLVTIICKLQEDPETESGYYWSSLRGRKIMLHDGTFMNLSITTSRFRPITLGIPALEELFAQ